MFKLVHEKQAIVWISLTWLRVLTPQTQVDSAETDLNFKCFEWGRPLYNFTSPLLFLGYTGVDSNSYKRSICRSVRLDSKWNSPLFYMNFTPFFSPLFWMNLTPFLDETHPFLNMNFTPFLHEFHPFLSQLLWLNITPFMKYIILSKIIVEDV